MVFTEPTPSEMVDLEMTTTISPSKPTGFDESQRAGTTDLLIHPSALLSTKELLTFGTTIKCLIDDIDDSLAPLQRTSHLVEVLENLKGRVWPLHNKFEHILDTVLDRCPHSSNTQHLILSYQVHNESELAAKCSSERNTFDRLQEELTAYRKTYEEYCQPENMFMGLHQEQQQYKQVSSETFKNLEEEKKQLEERLQDSKKAHSELKIELEKYIEEASRNKIWFWEHQSNKALISTLRDQLDGYSEQLGVISALIPSAFQEIEEASRKKIQLQGNEMLICTLRGRISEYDQESKLMRQVLSLKEQEIKEINTANIQLGHEAETIQQAANNKFIEYKKLIEHERLKSTKVKQSQGLNLQDKITSLETQNSKMQHEEKRQGARIEDLQQEIWRLKHQFVEAENSNSLATNALKKNLAEARDHVQYLEIQLETQSEENQPLSSRFRPTVGGIAAVSTNSMSDLRQSASGALNGVGYSAGNFSNTPGGSRNPATNFPNDLRNLATSTPGNLGNSAASTSNNARNPVLPNTPGALRSSTVAGPPRFVPDDNMPEVIEGTYVVKSHLRNKPKRAQKKFPPPPPDLSNPDRWAS